MLKSNSSAKSKIFHDKVYSSFMESPSIRLLMSMVPPAREEGVLDTLLREVFAAGITAGSASTMMELIEGLKPGGRPNG